MKPDEILRVVLREIRHFGDGWRRSPARFDARTLRNQMGSVADWAENALQTKSPSDFTMGAEFHVAQLLDCGFSSPEAERIVKDLERERSREDRSGQ